MVINCPYRASSTKGSIFAKRLIKPRLRRNAAWPA